MPINQNVSVSCFTIGPSFYRTDKKRAKEFSLALQMNASGPQFYLLLPAAPELPLLDDPVAVPPEVPPVVSPVPIPIVVPPEGEPELVGPVVLPPEVVPEDPPEVVSRFPMLIPALVKKTTRESANKIVTVFSYSHPLYFRLRLH